MRDHKEVISGIKRKEGVSYPVLVPNLQGFNSAVRFLYVLPKLVILLQNIFGFNEWELFLY